MPTGRARAKIQGFSWMIQPTGREGEDPKPLTIVTVIINEDDLLEQVSRSAVDGWVDGAQDHRECLVHEYEHNAHLRETLRKSQVSAPEGRGRRKEKIVGSHNANKISEKSTPSPKEHSRRHSYKEHPATKAKADSTATKIATTVENLPVSTVKGFNQKQEYAHNLFFSFYKNPYFSHIPTFLWKQQYGSTAHNFKAP